MSIETASPRDLALATDQPYPYQRVELVEPELGRGVDDGGRLRQGHPRGVDHAVQADRGGRSRVHKNLLTMRHAAAVFAAGRDWNVIYCVSCQL